MNTLIRRTRLRRALALLIAFVVASTGTVAGTASPAHAGLIDWVDSLEGPTPWATWEGGGQGDGVAGYDINGGVAYSGLNDGWLYVGNGWAANRIRKPLASMSPRFNCSAAVWFNVLASGAQVGLQIWDPNGWRVIAETYPWVAGGGYRQVYITGLNLQSYGEIYLQVIYGNNNGVRTYIRFDHMQLQCHY
ncbi:hypothetical protein [Microbispora triticiradicis]|uniref:hypothetical protein n=1 Tax=Microbispora triticiradicis TaxID=2200763 RepID=UPI0010584084|nr:hypothetical protein [Microbispora triticiradicis]GLW21895.1 hypothetical protein Mame01_19380 [Microbispora amethystogenes]